MKSSPTVVAAVGVVATLVGAAVVVLPVTATLALITLIVVATWLLIRPHHSVYLTLVLAIVTLPAAVPTGFQLGGFSFNFYEPALVVATLWAAAQSRPPRYARWGAGLVVAVLIVAALYGLFSGHPASKIPSDLKMPLMMAMAMFVAAGAMDTPLRAQCMRLTVWALWVSAVMTVLSSTAGLQLAGRAEGTSLLASGSSAATRLLTPATYPALAVLCCVVALLIAQRSTLPAVLPAAVPALLIVFLSFSRNNILALGVAIAFAFLASRSVDATTATAVRLLIWGPAAALVLAGVLSALPADSWVNQQVEGYSQRVLGGLDEQTINIDPSTRYRLQENEYLGAKILDSPIVGHGLGFAYQPGSGPPGQFFHDAGRYYAHNFYLWMLVKAGVIGLVLVLVAMLAPLLAALRSPSTVQLAVGSATAGLMAVSFVAPMPLGSPTAVLLGTLLGVLAVERSRSRSAAVVEQPA